MPIPFIVAGLAAATAAYGGKKAYDGYQTKSEAKDLLESVKSNHEAAVAQFEAVNDITAGKLENLGQLQLEIGQDFTLFGKISKDLLQKLNQNERKALEINNVPQHKLNKIEKFSISATEYLGTVVGAGATGAAAGFAVYGSVMTLAAASTGTSISALSGVAAYNATMAAIGGGSLATGGLGMAGGAAILGVAVAAPVLAVVGWAYNSHAEKSLDTAKKALIQSEEIVEKLKLAELQLTTMQGYIDSIHHTLSDIHASFTPYLTTLIEINQRLLNDEPIDHYSDEIMHSVGNGYAIAAIMTDLITTPLFKLKKDENGKPILENDAPQFAVDENDMQIFNQDELGVAIATARHQHREHNA